MNSFGTESILNFEDTKYKIHKLPLLEKQGYNISRLPYSLRILLENLLRIEDGVNIKKEDIEALLNWDPRAKPTKEIAFMPARVLLQDFTGIPTIVDFAAMRDAMHRLGGDPRKINPLQPVDLVIDHSIQVDTFGFPAAMQANLDFDFERNGERYQFLKWGQRSFDNFKVVPPNTGIVHQVNLEYLASVVFRNVRTGQAYPDTLVGTDSHTPMINGLGVLGWGVGGIEAEAAMLGQPISMLIPQVVGFKLTGELREGATATDFVLTVTEILRKYGVVDKFVEFYGSGLRHLSVADRATIGNMSPEYGATCGLFPVDRETLYYLRFTNRPEELVQFVEAYMKEQGLFYTPDSPPAEYSDHLELDLGNVEPCVAGPKRPQDRVLLSKARDSFWSTFPATLHPAETPESRLATAVLERGKTLVNRDTLTHGSVVIAAITSCTNTSNPSVMIAAGLLARKALQKGLRPKPWVKTSLAPGSMVVTRYLDDSGLAKDLDALGFDLVGYGCTTCIGNSGPLPKEVSKVVNRDKLAVVSVLSGNRNFEGRIHPEVKANYLMSPPLVVAYALAGNIDVDLTSEPLGYDPQSDPVYLKDIWPSREEIQETIEKHLRHEMFAKTYAEIFKGDERWHSLPVIESELYHWDPNSTYIRQAPFFEDLSPEPPKHLKDITGLRALALLGDSVTTDHISPAGNIKVDSPAGRYLIEHGVRPHLFNSYGARRGNHEVMIRGTFANVRLRNKLAPETEGGFTTYLPTGEVTTIYNAAMLYKESKTPLIILAGKEYGSGSSRDWAAKGPALLGVRVVLAESYERIHRSNLVGMGILPLQFLEGENIETLSLTGQEIFDIIGLSEAFEKNQVIGQQIEVRARPEKGPEKKFKAIIRIDTPKEVEYYFHGGILQYVLRNLLHKASSG
jgi:aconitate hydratase